MGKVKDFFNRIFGKQQALLNEENSVYSGSEPVIASSQGSIPNVFDSKYKVEKLQKPTFLPKIGTTEFAIEQYLYTLQDFCDNGIPAQSPSYKALTNLGCVSTNGDTIINGRNEELFLSRAQNREYSKKMNMDIQPKRNGEPCFYHVHTKSLSEKITRRLYLNFRKENVAFVADRLARKLGDNPYYFKFDANGDTSKRSEQMVFYIGEDPTELTNVCEAIETVKRENPGKFAESEKGNYFLSKIGSIYYAPNVNCDEYTRLDGKKEKIAKSYNTLLSTALSDSMEVAMKQLAGQFHIFGSNPSPTDFTYKDYLSTGVLSQILENDEMKKNLILAMKSNLQAAQYKNPTLEIQGLTKAKDQNQIR